MTSLGALSLSLTSKYQVIPERRVLDLKSDVLTEVTFCYWIFFCFPEAKTLVPILVGIIREFRKKIY